MLRIEEHQKDSVRDVILDGLKLCHTAECHDYELCPRHCGCGKHLDLHTAIAWTVAEKLGSLLDDKHLTLAKLRRVANAVEFAIYVVSLHKDDYHKLYTFLAQAYEVVYDIIKGR